MDAWVSDIDFETLSAPARLAKKVLLNPLGNYLPAGMLRWLLKATNSEVAQSNWSDAGGWRSMVISYDGCPQRAVDRLLVKSGTIPMALRNRKRLAARVIARLIDQVTDHEPHVLCLGAGPGQIIIDAMAQARRRACATLVDLNSDAFEYGRELAERMGVRDRVRFVQGDVRDVKDMLRHRVDIVKMIGICEYLEDDQIISIVKAAGQVMPTGAWIVFNSLSKNHGTDRFFRRVFRLHMNHRSTEHLRCLMSCAGFGDFVTYAEPLRVYEVVVGKKGSTAQVSPKGSL